MAVREFRDEGGRLWRAWDIRPEAIYPPTRSEDWLADCYITGWIVFETITADEKRRLCPWPINWAEADEKRLRQLLAAAEVVPAQRVAEQRRSSSTPSAQPAASEEPPTVPDQELDVTDLEVVRTFRYPGGRLWTVCVITHPEDGGRPVLRFAAGARFIDLKTWPKAWADEPNERLAEMLRDAAPRPRTTTFDRDTPRRRWNDEYQPRDQPRA